MFSHLADSPCRAPTKALEPVPPLHKSERRSMDRPSKDRQTAGMSGDVAPTPVALPVQDPSRRRSWRWPVVGVLGVLIALAGLWLLFGRGASASVGATVASCESAFTNPSSQGSAGDAATVVVGEGRVTGLAAFHVGGQWKSCFTGVGTGTATITSAQMRAVVSAPIAVVDGSYGAHTVLILVHHNRATQSVVVDGAWARSVVLARSPRFEVLELHVAHWPPWHVPWGHVAVQLGTVQGFDAAGRVTGSEPFDWCPGSINSAPWSGC